RAAWQTPWEAGLLGGFSMYRRFGYRRQDAARRSAPRAGCVKRTVEHEVVSRTLAGWARKKIRASLRKPGHQAYLRVPSIPSVAWQPYPSPLGRLRAHSFASPSRDGFAGSRMPRHKNCRGQTKLRTILPRMQVFRELFSKKDAIGG